MFVPEEISAFTIRHRMDLLPSRKNVDKSIV